MLIRLTKGQFATIDAADVDRVTPHKWSALECPHTFYAVRIVNGKTMTLHRFLLGDPADTEIDHIDRNGLNCSRSNLRSATSAGNKHNRLINPRSRSPYKGILFCQDNGKWQARISMGNRTYSLGRYSSPELAARIYDEAVRLLAGEFGRYNFPLEGERSARPLSPPSIP